MENSNNNSIHNPVVQPSAIFIKKFKIGVYRELHKKGLLAKEQLDTLIALQKDEAYFTSEL